MKRAILVSLFTGFLSAMTAGAALSATSGHIIVAGDENWTAISDATTLTLATRIGKFFAPTGGGKFLFHVERSLPWLQGAAFLAGLKDGGNTITFDDGGPGTFTHTLSDYDAVFVARQYANDRIVPTAALTAYVKQGGNVFVSLGSALNNDTGANEATAWNPFLNAFGLAILPSYNALVGDVAIISSDPLFKGVSTLYHNVGATIVSTGSNSHARLIASYPGQALGQGLFAIYEPGDGLFSGALVMVQAGSPAPPGYTFVGRFVLSGAPPGPKPKMEVDLYRQR
jgi:hypothetical protein